VAGRFPQNRIRVLTGCAVQCSSHRLRRLGSLRRWSDGLAGYRSSEDEAQQQAPDVNVIFDQYGQRNEEDRREVDPPIQVQMAAWSKLAISIGG
jgi:hypothetical protein